MAEAQRAEIQATIDATNSRASGAEEDDHHEADPMQIEPIQDDNQDNRMSDLDVGTSGNLNLCPTTRSSESGDAGSTHDKNSFDTCE